MIGDWTPDLRPHHRAAGSTDCAGGRRTRRSPHDADNPDAARLLRFAPAMTLRVGVREAPILDQDICINGGMNGS